MMKIRNYIGAGEAADMAGLRLNTLHRRLSRHGNVIDGVKFIRYGVHLWVRRNDWAKWCNEHADGHYDMIDEDDTEYVSVREATAHYGCAQATIRSRIADGRLPVTQQANVPQLWIPKSALDTDMEIQKQDHHHSK